MQLRDYQVKLKDDIYGAWRDGAINVLAVAPTGSGKTRVKAAVFKDTGSVAIAIAHRQELVGQIADALAECGVHHRIIAPTGVIRFCIAQQVEKYGRSFISASSRVAVAGVNTLIARADSLKQFCNQVALWDIDEAHHVTSENQWGKAVALFPNARGLGLTATPVRADRKPLGRKRGGVFDQMVVGPPMTTLIDQGFLSGYRVFGPPQSIDRSAIELSASTGDFKPESMRKEIHKSTITGDMVKHYITLAGGKRGISFVVDVETAVQTAAAFNAAGVRAEAISANTPDRMQLVNVDLFGEGMDCPALECVSFGRPTESFGLYMQQFGRVMRPSPGKGVGIVIDHVGNVRRHRLPDRNINWSLYPDVNERGKRAMLDDSIPVTTCIECFRVFESVTKTCPYCGAEQTPEGRSRPQFIDGDLTEYSAELLAELRGEIARIDGPPLAPSHLSGFALRALHNNWHRRQVAQSELRDCIATWAGIEKYVAERADPEIYRRFYHTFGIDVMTAQTLNEADAAKLAARIRERLT
jgi:DNA repair protein RadD